MGSPLKRRRAQDDLGEPPRKFSKCCPFQVHARQPHRSPFTIHRSDSFHDDLVNGLPAVADESCPSSDKLLSPTADEENAHPTPLEHCHSTAAQRSRRKPLQEHADAEGNVGNEDSNSNRSRECWVTHDGELYTTVTGPLARNRGDEWKTLKWLQFKDEVLPDTLKPPCDFETPTPTTTPPRRKPDAVAAVNRPPRGQPQVSAGDQNIASIVEKWINKWTNDYTTSRCRQASAF